MDGRTLDASRSEGYVEEMNGPPNNNNNYPPGYPPGAGYAPPAGGFGAAPSPGYNNPNPSLGYGPAPGFNPHAYGQQQPGYGGGGGYGGSYYAEPAFTHGSPSLRWWILGSYLGMMVVGVVGGMISGIADGNEVGMMIGNIISFLVMPLFLTYFVVALVWIYKSWEMLPPTFRMTDGGTMVTPGQAVGYLFIPFYNLYWYFVCSVGLCSALNRVLAAYGSPKRASTGLAIAAAITQLIPYINFVFAPWLWIAFMFNVESAKREYARISTQVALSQLR